MPKTHQKTNTRLFNIWVNMRQRCTNPNWTDYHRYGGRGISFCKEWNNFMAFYNWATSNGYKSNLTLERIDNDGDYKPSNCKWATVKQQANNRSSNRVIEYLGVSKTLAEWSETTGILRATISKRIEAAWPMSEVFRTRLNARKDNYIQYNGKKKTIIEWSKELGININTLRSRLRKWPIEKAFQTKVETKYASNS